MYNRGPLFLLVYAISVEGLPVVSTRLVTL